MQNVQIQALAPVIAKLCRDAAFTREVGYAHHRAIEAIKSRIAAFFAGKASDYMVDFDVFYTTTLEQAVELVCAADDHADLQFVVLSLLTHSWNQTLTWAEQQGFPTIPVALRAEFDAEIDRLYVEANERDRAQSETL